MDTEQAFEVWAINWAIMETPGALPIRGTIGRDIKGIPRGDLKFFYTFTPAGSAGKPSLIRGADVFETEAEAFEAILRNFDLRAEALLANVEAALAKNRTNREKVRASYVEAWHRANPRASLWQSFKMTFFGL